MFEFEACEVFETKELTFVNDCFKYEPNEEIEHYRQTLINKNGLNKGTTNQRKAYILALLAVLAWSTMSSAFKLTLRYVSYYDLIFWSVFYGIIILFFILLVTGKLRNIKNITKRDLVNSMLMGLLNPFLYYLVLIKAYDLLEAQVAGTLNYIWPIVLVLLSIPMLKQKIKLHSLVAIFISFAGIIIIISRGNPFTLHFTNVFGVALAISSALFWALYWIVNMKDNREATEKIFLNMIFGLIYLVLFMLLTRKDFVFPSLQGFIGTVYIGIFEMSVTFVIWLKALNYSKDTAKVSNIIYLSPFLGLFWINQTVGESIHWYTIVGLVFIITGILLQSLYKINRRREN